MKRLRLNRYRKLYYKGFKSSVNDFTIDMPSGFYYQIDYEDKETGMVTSTNASFYDTDSGFSKTALKSMELVEGIRAMNYNGYPGYERAGGGPQ